MRAITRVTVISAALLSGCGESQATNNVTIDEDAIKSTVMQDSAAQDFLVTDDGAIYVGVLDNGSNRDGYAASVCEVVRENATGEGNRLVRIIDIAAVSRGEGFKTLGRHQCEV
ncbi:hypothetical protein [Halomonas sp. BMC6]|uniref:hypothetical protein n=1 Tax=Halomonas sp. BMC6 TaxID=3073244 RepID=UPI0030D46850